MPTRDACPPPDILDRYIEGILVRDRVGEVTHHVTHCARCRAAIESVVAIKYPRKRRRSMPRRVWWLAAAAVLLTVSVPLLRERSDAAAAQDAFRRLVAASPRSERVIEPRLTGGFPW